MGIISSTAPANLEFNDFRWTGSDDFNGSNFQMVQGHHGSWTWGAGVILEARDFDKFHGALYDRRSLLHKFKTSDGSKFKAGDVIEFDVSGGNKGHTFVILVDGNDLYVDTNDNNFTGKGGDRDYHSHMVEAARPGTVSGPNGSARLIESSRDHILSLPSLKTKDADIKRQVFHGEARMFNETRWTADEYLYVGGYHHSNKADFFKVEGGTGGELPRELVFAGLVWNVVASRDIVGSPHQDVWQSINVNNNTRDVKLTMKNMMVGVGPYGRFGAKIQNFMLNSLGKGGLHPDSIVENCIIDGNGNGNILNCVPEIDTITFRRCTLVCTGTHSAAIPYFRNDTPSLKANRGNSRIIADRCVVGYVNGSRTETPGTFLADDRNYKDHFPNWSQDPVDTPEELIHRYTPGPSVKGAGAITEDGRWVDEHGTQIAPGPQFLAKG